MHEIVPLIFFVFLGVIIIVPQVLKSRDRQRMYETMRMAYERGQPVPPEFLSAMNRRDAEVDVADIHPQASHNRDLRRGVVWTAIGVGLLFVGLSFYWGLYEVGGAAETFMSFGALAAVPLCVGLAFIALWYFSRDKTRV